MGIVVTQNFVLAPPEEGVGLSADHPIIGWRTIVTPTTITSDSSDVNFPASNMANPATHLRWKRAAAPSSFGYITITASGAGLVDYVAIARHNLGSQAIPIAIGYGGGTWTELVSPIVLPDDGPALFRFAPQALATVQIRLGTSTNIPEIAVAYAGKLLTLPRKIYQGFAPINYGRIAKITNGRSEAGNFLGRIVLQEFVKDSVPLSLIDPAYFRNFIAEFLVDSKENPFFFAWRPQSYPYEIGYCHMTNDPMPTNEAPHGLIAMQMEMTGVV